MTFGLNPMNQRPDSMVEDSLEFKDFLPFMAMRLGPEGLIEELCKGFRLLMDTMKGVITLESLRRNAVRLGLEGLADDELLGMLREGDLDEDGALDQTEFCILMFRLSPELMQGSRRMLDEALGMGLSSVVL
ncbi:Calcium-binding protein PBP1 [Cocos nucifera]|uniref:Calcium-binding protein PBP1 n=1 Tax=Cocos nucifera TaxID=13894 RepID=A0A8K0N3M8_COCNU|nr:Calcium-binding protein PBP1 [Cocos nucifera]